MGHRCPKMSFSDKALTSIGTTHPVEPRKIKCVLYPEKGLESQAVLPRPNQSKRNHPDDQY